VKLSHPRHFKPVLAPAAILLAAVLALAIGPALPPSLSGLKTLVPYVLLLLGAGMGVWFNRGRAFVAFASLLAAYAGYSLVLEFGAATFAARAIYTAIALLVPLNILLSLLLPERGVFHHFNYRWLMLAVAEVLLVAWVASAGRTSLSGTVWQDLLEHWLFRSPPTPVAGRLLFVAALIAAIWRAWPRPPRTHTRPLDIGLAGTLVAFFIACEWVAELSVFDTFIAAAGAVMLVSLLQESHRLAFRDELTGLPSRRALEERLHGLGPVHAIGMVDVDHFKKFNDTHGHDIGDQVLKLVAARLAEIGGGGDAYRYGGEEFCLLFDGCTLEEALPHADQIRADIAAYEMAVRQDDRPKDAEAGTRLRSMRSAEKSLSVTVSIGIAEPDGPRSTPAEVIRAADKALYRAKESGRNRVSR